MAGTGAVGVGIVGTGLSATQHLTALKDVANGHVVAVSGTSIDKARAFAATWCIPNAYATADELIADPQVEVVHTCTPPDTRVALVGAAATAGKHVLVEKPMARTSAEAQTIIDICDQHGVWLSAMFQNRFTPLARRVKAAIDGGELGRILLVNLTAKWFRTEAYYAESAWRGTANREGGAVVINQAIHAIDLVRWIFGPVNEVTALTATQLQPISTEDVGMALLRFESGAVGSIVATTVAYPGFPDRLEIHGTRGSLVLAQGEGRLEWSLRDEPARIETASSQVSAGSSDPAATPSAGHIGQFTDLYDAIRNGRPPFVDGRDGRHAVELVEAIYRAAATRLPVRLPL